MGCTPSRKDLLSTNSISFKRMLSTGPPSKKTPLYHRGLSFLKARSGKLSSYFIKPIQIGSGGFGVVYKAVEKETGFMRAIKVLPKTKVKLTTILSEVQHLRELVMNN